MVENIRVINNQLVIYDSETDKDLAVIPNNEKQLSDWENALAIRKNSLLTSEGEQKTSDEYHIALYEHFISEYNREIVNIIPLEQNE